MTHPSDIAGLSERLREIRGKLTLDIDREWLATIDEAATALDSLSARVKEADEACQRLCGAHGFATGHGDSVADMIDEFSVQITARVKELEVQNLALRALVKDGDDVEEERDRARSERDSILKTKRSTTQRAQDFYVRFREAESRALRAEREGDEAYERAATAAWEAIDPSQEGIARTCAEEAVNAIRRLASGPEGGALSTMEGE